MNVCGSSTVEEFFLFSLFYCSFSSVNAINKKKKSMRTDINDFYTSLHEKNSFNIENSLKYKV